MEIPTIFEAVGILSFFGVWTYVVYHTGYYKGETVLRNKIKQEQALKERVVRERSSI